MEQLPIHLLVNVEVINGTTLAITAGLTYSQERGLIQYLFNHNFS